MMYKLLINFLIIFSLNILSADADAFALFATEEAAQNNCPADTVVWLNLPTGIWHPKGGRWYGRTKIGSFVCKEEALAAGDRASLNGE